jgi:hypothetical protein
MYYSAHYCLIVTKFVVRGQVFVKVTTSNFTKICRVGAMLIHADRYDEADRHILQVCKCA